MQKRAYIVIAVVVIAVVVIAVASIVVWKSNYFRPVPSYPFAMGNGEQVASWNFKGAYTGNAELTAKANTEIKRLKGLFGGKEFSDYILDVSIANQYDLQGDGANEFLYLKRALALDSDKTGLAWYNLGQLLGRLGAYQSARMALEKAVTVEPLAQYGLALKDFEKNHPETVPVKAGS